MRESGDLSELRESMSEFGYDRGKTIAVPVSIDYKNLMVGAT